MFVDNNMEEETKRKEELIRTFFDERLPSLNGKNIRARGLGVMWGVEFGAYPSKVAFDIRKRCFEKGVILELCGREDTVVKIMAACTIPDDVLMKGLEIVFESMKEVLAEYKE